MRTYVHLQILKEVLNNYAWPEPFHLHLKKKLKDRKAGSRDRRELRSAAYNYWRVKNALPDLNLTQQILTGSFICLQEPSPLLNDWLGEETPLKPEDTTLPTEEKINLVKAAFPGFEAEQVFPLRDHISPALSSKTGFLYNHLRQAPVFIKPFAKGMEGIIKELQSKDVPYEVQEDVISLPPDFNSTNLSGGEGEAFFIADLSTVKLGKILETKAGESWWDACAGSGGKSLILLDQNAGTEIWASDSRKNILRNYRQRLEAAGFKWRKTFTADLSKKPPESIPSFDNVLLDAPCSGSGTWNRNPEHLANFTTATLDTYLQKQKNLLENTFLKVKQGGHLYYITCSVYAAENEDIINEFLSSEGQAKHLSSGYIECWENGGGTLYFAVIQKS